jgi:hypothetical protein
MSVLFCGRHSVTRRAEGAVRGGGCESFGKPSGFEGTSISFKLRVLIGGIIVDPRGNLVFGAHVEILLLGVEANADLG